MGEINIEQHHNTGPVAIHFHGDVSVQIMDHVTNSGNIHLLNNAGCIDGDIVNGNSIVGYEDRLRAENKQLRGEIDRLLGIIENLARKSIAL